MALVWRDKASDRFLGSKGTIRGFFFDFERVMNDHGVGLHFTNCGEYKRNIHRNY